MAAAFDQALKHGDMSRCAILFDEFESQVAKRRKRDPVQAAPTSSSGFTAINVAETTSDTQVTISAASTRLPLEPCDGTRSTYSRSATRAKRRDPLLKSYLGLGVRGTLQEHAVIGIVDSTDEQVRNAATSVRRLNALRAASSRSRKPSKTANREPKNSRVQGAAEASEVYVNVGGAEPNTKDLGPEVDSQVCSFRPLSVSGIPESFKEDVSMTPLGEATAVSHVHQMSPVNNSLTIDCDGKDRNCDSVKDDLANKSGLTQPCLIRINHDIEVDHIPVGADFDDRKRAQYDDGALLELINDLNSEDGDSDDTLSNWSIEPVPRDQAIEITPEALYTATAASTHPPQPVAPVCAEFPKPIVRPAFPDNVRDRSPVTGVSAAESIRVCFRVGEALNVGSQGVRTGASILLEMYARVETSYREPENGRQHFTFTDLWAEKGPTLTGEYDGWKVSALWDADSSAFLGAEGAKKMCRCIAKMKRKDREWKLSVLGIWEVDWDDVEHARELVAA